MSVRNLEADYLVIGCGAAGMAFTDSLIADSDADVSGDRCQVKVRRRLIDATYLEPSVPATCRPPFDSEPGVRYVAVNELARLAEPAKRYVIIGAGKTAIDACLWLLQSGVAPSDICRIKPRATNPTRAALNGMSPVRIGCRVMEATRDDLAEKNRLCPPNRLPNVPLDWVRGTVIGTNADYLWSREPDITAWLDRARLNPSRGLRQRGDEPRVRQAMNRFAHNVRPGLARLTQFLAEAELLVCGASHD